MGPGDRRRPMSDDELFESMGRALEDRPGWHYEPSTTPGGLPSWCLDPGGKVTLSAAVIDGVVTVYVPESDRDLAVGGVPELVAWLDAYGDEYLAG
jgi:hypothetical protein